MTSLGGLGIWTWLPACELLLVSDTAVRVLLVEFPYTLCAGFAWAKTRLSRRPLLVPQLVGQVAPEQGAVEKALVENGAMRAAGGRSLAVCARAVVCDCDAQLVGLGPRPVEDGDRDVQGPIPFPDADRPEEDGA